MSLGNFAATALGALAVLLLPISPVSGQLRPEAARSVTDSLRIARLAGLGRAWGAVKFFHPYLGYQEIDWDKALVETIPRVNKARTAAEYSAAINYLLSHLNDRNTYAELRATAKPPGAAPKVKVDDARLVRLTDGVLIVDAMRIAETLADDNAADQRLMKAVAAHLPRATGIVLDFRSANESTDWVAYFFGNFTRSLLVELLDSSVTLGSIRSRIHNGYAPQRGGTSGGYYSGFVARTPGNIVASSKAKQLPMAVIINAGTPSGSEILSGLQAARRVFVVRDGDDGRELDSGPFQITLPDDVRVKMRTTELLYPGGNLGFRADLVVRKDAHHDAGMAEALRAVRERKSSRIVGQPATAVSLKGTNDRAYAEMDFPTPEYRLLALFRFWNVIEYFFPYKHLIDSPWNEVLQRYIPKLESNKDAVDYQLTLRELISETRDSHVNLSGATKKSNDKLGMFVPPVHLRYVEGQTIVASEFDTTSGLKVGDVIVAIDGEPVERRRQYVAGMLAESTPQAMARRVHYRLLRGQKDAQARLTVRGTDSLTREVQIARSMSFSDPRRALAFQRTTPVVSVLPSGVGYVDLARLQRGEVDRMFETIKPTRATIFDMRGYPNGTAWAIAPRLTRKVDVTGALFSRPMREAVMLSDDDLKHPSFTFPQKLPAREGEPYSGKVVMLINEDAISQSEHTALFFEAATDVTFIGTPTMGANGDVTNMILPGDLTVSFSGHDVRHADGRQLQRLGIQPHIRVAPTIRGIVAGRDEVLEAAIAHLAGGKGN